MAHAIKERGWCLIIMGCYGVPDITILEEMDLGKEKDFGDRIREIRIREIKQNKDRSRYNNE